MVINSMKQKSGRRDEPRGVNSSLSFPFGEPVADNIQPDLMFEPGLQPREHPAKTADGTDQALEDRFFVAGEFIHRDADKGSVLIQRLEGPYGTAARRSVRAPFN